jgi:membrane fusion protein, multidrug efflux system
MPNLVSLTLVKINKVYARVSVAEDEVTTVHKGQKAIIVVGALGSASWAGTVEEIGVVADPMVHTYKMRIGILNKDLSLKPGMICSVTIDNAHGVHGMLVPGRAVMIDESGRKFVYIVSPEKKALRKYIVVGRLLNNGVEVLEGLQLDNEIVVAGQHKLVDGALVEIVKEG